MQNGIVNLVLLSINLQDDDEYIVKQPVLKVHF